MHVENEVYKRNNKLLLCSINGTNREQDYLEMLRHNKVDGVVAITYSPIEHYLSSEIPLSVLTVHTQILQFLVFHQIMMQVEEKQLNN